MARTNDPKHRRVKTIINIVTLLALGILIYALRDQIVQTYNNLSNVNLWFITFMPLLQYVNYHAYTKMYQEVYRVLGDMIDYKKLMRVQLELNYVNNVFPSGGVSGISYFSVRMRDLGATAGKSTLVQVIKFALVFISFQILLGVGLLILAAFGQANSVLILIASSLTTLLLVGTLFMAYIMGSRKRINNFFSVLTRWLNKAIARFRKDNNDTISIAKVQAVFNDLHDNYMLLRNDLKQLKKPLLYALLANLSEVMTIYVVYLAFGFTVNPGAVIIAYAVSNFAGFISVMPGGIGIYEALMTATLAAAGVPAAQSLPVTIMYRILNSFIQLPIGGYFYHKALSVRVPREQS